jgi:hypothetical protein
VRISLDDCRAKLDRAKGHVEELRAEIEREAANNSGLISLQHEYDPNDRAVIYRINYVVQIHEHWPLIFGDAVHNLRCALDHLMWQLAVIHLRRQPTTAEAKQIQFPVVSRAKDFTRSNRFLRHIRNADIDRLKPFQPYKRRRKGEMHPLPKLVYLSNVDKHRKLHLLVVAPQSASFTNRPDAYRDCVPDPRLMPDGSMAHALLLPPRRPPRPGDVILRTFVHPIGSNPDVEFDASFTGYVATGKLGPILPMLDDMVRYVSSVIQAFKSIT